MIYLNAFLFAGVVCMICQVVLDNTNFTPGHITSGVTVIGAFLSFFGLYENIINKCGAGATVLIANFGHILYTAAVNGYNENGLLGLLSNMLNPAGVAIVSVIIFSFVFTIFFKAKD